MVPEIFKSVLLMSAVGSLLSVILLCLKPVTRRLFSPRWQYYIWLTVLVVMILPVRFNLPGRMLNLPIIPTEQVQNVQTEIQKPIADDQTVFAELSLPKMKLPRSVFYRFADLWLFTAIFVFVEKIIKYHLFLREIHKNSKIDTSIKNIPKHLKVQRTNMLDAPLIVGLLQPTLFLPSVELAEKDMSYILMHELTHYKRKDLWYKWFAMAVKSVHWFNPFVYIVSGQIDLEGEISCDFAVTSKLGKDEQNGYMSMILSLLSNSKSNLRPLTTQMSGGKKILKRRFTMIRNKKKTGKMMAALSAVIAVAILGTTVFASGALADMAAEDNMDDKGENNAAVFDRENLKEPEKTVTYFFEAFADSDFTLMKNYCTENCVNKFFGDGHCFGVTKADIAKMEIDPLEYAKSSNDFNVFVTVNMTPHELSVFDISQTSTSFYVMLQRQPDGEYLIDGFATGL